jgi:ADP-ribosyl-[dinitrogen reductase] hydrolase
MHMMNSASSDSAILWLRDELLSTRLRPDESLPDVVRWIDLDVELAIAGGRFLPGQITLTPGFVGRLYSWRLAGLKPLVATVSMEPVEQEPDLEIVRMTALEIDTLTGGMLDAVCVLPTSSNPLLKVRPPSAGVGSDPRSSSDELMMDPLVRKRMLGALLGLAVGDSLGAPVENWPAEKILKVHGAFGDYVSGRGWGPGQPTRETTFALIWFRELANRRSVHTAADRDRIGRILSRWVSGRPRDFGHLTRGILRKYRAVPPVIASRMMWEGAGRMPEFNAALSRACAVAIAIPGDRDLRLASVLAASAMTHPAPVCLSAALCVSEGLAASITGKDPLSAARSSALDDRVSAALECVADRWSPGGDSWNGHERGHPLKTLQAAFWAAGRDGTFEDILLSLIHEGGDADTHGAVGGAFLGAREGSDAIPARWLSRLKTRSTLVRLMDALLGDLPSDGPEDGSTSA